MKELLSAFARGGRVGWIESVAYVRRVTGRTRLSPCEQPSEFVLLLRDAQSLLPSHAVIVPAEEFYPEALDAVFEAGDPVERLQRIWHGKERDSLQKVLDGLDTLLQPLVPILLRVPSPSAWLRWAGGRAAAVDEGAVDAAAMYLAEYLRTFSASPVSGLILDDEDLQDELVRDLYAPVWNAARHYGWSTGLRIDSPTERREVPPELDFVLDRSANCERLEELWSDGSPFGGGLTPEFWNGTANVSARRAFGYGTVPEGASPEIVLARHRAWREV